MHSDGSVEQRRKAALVKTKVSPSLLFVAKRSVNQIAYSSDLWIRRGDQRSPERGRTDLGRFCHAQGEVKWEPEPQWGSGSRVAR